jgi:hypothetical protein
MATRRINVERFSLTSRKSFQDVLRALDAAIGHPAMNEFWKRVREAKTASEMEKVIHSAVGPSGLMEFARFDHGEIVHKGKTADFSGIVRLVVGNPLIMREMVRLCPMPGPTRQ